MIVELEAELFKHGRSIVALVQVFGYALEGRHRVLLAEGAEDAFNHWISEQSADLQSQCRLALDTSTKEEALSPAGFSLVVTGETDQTEALPPRLSLARAIDVLRSPLRILMEHDESDSSFLIAFATEDDRRRIDELLKTGVIEWAHCGGIAEVERRVTRIKTPTVEARQFFALFDSDALVPGEPSRQSASVHEACTAKHVEFHQTRRRFQESYLPTDALRAWGLQKKRLRWSKTQALLELGPEQRHHSNLKSGFDGDTARLQSLRDRDPEAASRVDQLYGDVLGRRRQLLANGLARDIGALFRGAERPTETALRKDGSWDEMNAVVRTILKLAR